MRDSIDELLREKLGAATASLHLPTDCSARLVSRIRARRRAQRFKLMVVILLLAVGALALCGFPKKAASSAHPDKTILIAGDGESVPEVQAGWMFFSMVTNCMRRIKIQKRKEEEE